MLRIVKFRYYDLKLIKKIESMMKANKNLLLLDIKRIRIRKKPYLYTYNHSQTCQPYPIYLLYLYVSEL